MLCASHQYTDNMDMHTDRTDRVGPLHGVRPSVFVRNISQGLSRLAYLSSGHLLPRIQSAPCRIRE